MSAWEKLPAVEGKTSGCLNAGRLPNLFPADAVIAVGFGYAALLSDGVERYVEPSDPRSDDAYMTGAQAEVLAAHDPDHDWRIVMRAPLCEGTYQRHEAGQWVLVEQGEGFA